MHDSGTGRTTLRSLIRSMLLTKHVRSDNANAGRERVHLLHRVRRHHDGPLRRECLELLVSTSTLYSTHSRPGLALREGVDAARELVDEHDGPVANERDCQAEFTLVAAGQSRRKRVRLAVQTRHGEECRDVAREIGAGDALEAAVQPQVLAD